MATKSGKSPSFPPYTLSSDPVYRSLFLLEGHSLYNKEGHRFAVEDYEGLVSFLFSHNAMAFVSSLTDSTVFPFLGTSVQDGLTDVTCSKQGIPSSVVCKKQSSNRKIVSYRSWRGGEADTYLDIGFLREMDELYRYCGVGTYGTPGALGYALQLQLYGQNSLHHHYAPGRMAQKFLWEHHTGGRCDTLVPLYKHTHHTYTETIELDMSTAYGAHFQEHPTGTACPVVGPDAPWRYPTFFVECEVTIPYTLALGPFPVRRGKGKLIDYPKSRGVYRTYLWKEQLIDCEQLGCTVRCIRGYGWKYLTSDNSTWAKYTYALRMGSPTQRIEKDIKAAIVGGIGRHGMHNEFYHLVPSPLSDDDRTLADSSPMHKPLRYFVHKTTDYTKAAMTHWYGYTIAQTARSLFWYSLPYAEAGTLLMTNYDALMIDAIDPPTGVHEKHTLAAKMAAMGDLRWQRLTNVKILAARHVECDQKTTRPGVKLEGRTRTA